MPKPVENVPVSSSSDSYKPGWFMKAQLWLVGAPLENGYYKAKDAQNISVAAPLLVLTSLFAGGCATLALTSFMGVAMAPAVGVGAFWALLYGSMDRTIMSIESRNKAAEKVRQLTDITEKTYKNLPSRILEKIPAHIGVLLRIGVALASGFVVGETVISSKIFHDDIQVVLSQHFKKANAPLIEYNDRMKAGYDAETEQRKETLKSDQEQLDKARSDRERVGMPVDFDSSAYNARLAQYVAQQDQLRESLSAAQSDQTQQKAIMDAEETGADTGGALRTSRQAGKGPKWQGAKIQFDQATQTITTLQQQIDKIASLISEVRQDIQKGIGNNEASRQASVQTVEQKISSLTSEIQGLTQLIKDRDDARNAFFNDLDEKMKANPKFVDQETGLLSSLAALDELIRQSDEAGNNTPSRLSLAMIALLVGLELSSVASALMRKPTGAELKAAYDDLMEEVAMDKVGKFKQKQEYSKEGLFVAPSWAA